MPDTATPCKLLTPAAWRGSDLIKKPEKWLYKLNTYEVKEIELALLTFNSRRKTFLEATSRDFPLPTLGEKLRLQMNLLESGPGFFLMRGVPVENKSEDDARCIAWGLGLHLGVALPQDAKGTMIADVRDRGLKSAMTLRGNASNEKIDFHVDSADVVTLLCRRKSKSGGRTMLTSSMEVHNEITLRRPDILFELYRPLPFFNVAAKDSNVKPYFLCPVFGFHEGNFTSRYYRARILAGSEVYGAFTLSKTQRESIDLVQEIASDPSFYFEMDFEPGDLQIVNNHVIYHARTPFEDFPEFDRKRHLFRQWLSVPCSRPLSPLFRDAYGRIGPGTIRGGYAGWKFEATVDDFQKRVATELGMIC